MAFVSGTELIVGTSVLTATEITGAYLAFVGLPTISRTAIVASSSSVSTSLLVPLGAVVTQAVARVEAAAPGTTTIGGLATVRASAGEPDAMTSELVIDFGTLRTVSALAAPSGVSITSVMPWVGTKFDGTIALSPSSGNAVTFTERQTERLLVTVATNVAPDAMAADGLLTTTTPPADLELTVAGTRVWFRVGPVPVDFVAEVDITTAVQTAVAAATVGDEDGNVAVALALTARVPGDLDLSLPAPPRFLRTHLVAFPGPSTAAPFLEEGVADVSLPLPAEAADWVVHRIVATVAPRDPGPLRVLAPDGPPISTEADLLLDVDRRLVARLPRATLARFDRLAGVRLLLTPGADGIELGGALLTGTADLPGEAVANATFTPLSVPAGPGAWVSLLLPQPVVLGKVTGSSPYDRIWISIGVTRGTARLALADSSSMADDDRAVLRRIAPNGVAKPLSVVHRPRAQLADPPVAVAADTAALRVIGIAPATAPVDVVALDVPAADGSVGGTDRLVDPGGTVSVTLDPVGPRYPLSVRLTATAATTVTLGPVVIAYAEAIGAGP
ncbi:MAG TPA: hypothetical protein VIT41_19005 [Microlunatus sp.]